MNGRRAKAIRREIQRRYPRGVERPYDTGGQRVNPGRQIKKQIIAEKK